MDNQNIEFSDEVINAEESGIMYEDLMMAASGVDEENKPVSMVTIVVDKINSEGENVTDNMILLDQAIFNFFVSGGCLVAQADFAGNGAFQYQRAVEYLSTFLDNAQDEEYMKSHAFGVVVVPMILEGKVTIVLQDLVYFTGIDMPNSEKRLIMCFNDLESQTIYNGDEINMQEIRESVEMQMSRDVARMDQEIAAINQEIEDIKNNNPYQQNVMDKYNQMPDFQSGNSNDDSNSGGSSWMRISKD